MQDIELNAILFLRNISLHVEAPFVHLVLLQSHGRVGLDEVKVDFVTKKFSNIAHSVSAITRQFKDWKRKYGGTHLIMVGLSRLNPHP
jgi:hypothetical protein